MARLLTLPFILILVLSSLAAACGGNPPVSETATAPATAAAPTAAPSPTATATAPPKPAALPAGSPSLPATTYPARTGTGEMLTGEAAQDRIAQPGTPEREQFETVLASMGTDAPTDERVFLLNTSDPEHPNWTYLPGNSQQLYVAVVREGGVEKIDPSLHDWRVGHVTGVEMVRWQEVTPPPGADNLRLVANGTTTVIGAFQGDTLVYWLSTEANNGQGDWRPNDSTMPDGAGNYSFDAERNTWVTQVGEVVYAYEAGQWVEVVAPTPEPTPMSQLGEVRDGQWWDGAGWQALPDGEGWQVSVGEDGRVRALNADGVEYLFEENSWIKASESYSHITTAPDGSPLSEYVEATGARVKPAIHLGDGAFELVPAGAILPTHIFDKESASWRQVNPDNALFNDVDTSTWFTARGSEGSIYEGLEMPIRVTTKDVSTLSGVEYSVEAQEFYMVYWLRMCHVAHTYQQRGNEATVDFETYVQMIKDGDPDAQIYVYKYELSPDSTRGALRQQMVDPAKGVTIQVVHDRAFEHNPLATVTNPNNAGPKFAFIMDATQVGQAAVAVNLDPDYIDTITDENKWERLTLRAMSAIDALQWVALYSTSYAMQYPDANSDGLTIPREDTDKAVKKAIEYLEQQLGGIPEYPFDEMVDITFN
jgi:hypothetical protein